LSDSAILFLTRPERREGALPGDPGLSDNGHPALSVAVHLFVRQFRKGDLPQVVEKILKPGRSGLIVCVAYFALPWLGATKPSQFIAIGVGWLVLTPTFEFFIWYSVG
jgi:hypothetical protein